MELNNFKEVIDRYKVIFFDSFGVLKTHNMLIPGIEKTFEYLKESGKEFYVLTNDASRSPEQLADAFIRLGLGISPTSIISSGMLARDYLVNKTAKGTIAYLGTQASAHYLEQLGMQTISIRDLHLSNADEIGAVVFMDDEGFDWNTDLTKTVNLLRKRNIPVIVANTDHTYPVSQGEVAIAIGAVAKMVENIVGKYFLRFGKPDAQMFIFAHEHINNFRVAQKHEILMVGDTLNTDILGGNKYGLDTVLVLTGNTQAENAEVRIRSTGIIPTYICKSAVVD